jgi:3-hydroxymyristoyl/3-hydroxydecanoyl-(acyl carrier protein) dehydratase
MFHYNADSTDGEIVVPGTSLKLSLNGLNASKRVIAARKSNMFIGCDLVKKIQLMRFIYQKLKKLK